MAQLHCRCHLCVQCLPGCSGNLSAHRGCAHWPQARLGMPFLRPRIPSPPCRRRCGVGELASTVSWVMETAWTGDRKPPVPMLLFLLLLLVLLLLLCLFLLLLLFLLPFCSGSTYKGDMKSPNPSPPPLPPFLIIFLLFLFLLLFFLLHLSLPFLSSSYFCFSSFCFSSPCFSFTWTGDRLAQVKLASLASLRACVPVFMWVCMPVCPLQVPAAVCKVSEQ